MYRWVVVELNECFGLIVVNNWIDLIRFDGGERTVKKLRLSKALTISEGTTVSEACRRMAARRVNCVLLTDSNALLSGIMTDKVSVSAFCFFLLECMRVCFCEVLQVCVLCSGHCYKSYSWGFTAWADYGFKSND